MSTTNITNQGASIQRGSVTTKFDGLECLQTNSLTHHKVPSHRR